MQDDTPASFLTAESVLALPKSIFWLLCIVITLIILTAISLYIDSLFQKRKRRKLCIPTAIPQTDSISSFNAENFVDSISNTKVILFAGATTTSIPVNLIVNSAISNAQKSRRTLLVDLDIERKPIENVFEIDTSKNLISRQKVPADSFLANLSLFPASYFEDSTDINIETIIDSHKKNFDNIFIYCPALETLPEKDQIIASAQANILFSDSNEQLTRMNALFEQKYIVANFTNTKQLHKSA